MTKGIFFLISLFVLQEVSAVEQQDWKLQKDKNGIKIYIKEVPDSPMNAFKGTTIISSSLDQYEALLRDVENFSEWMHSLKKAEVKEQLEENKRVLYTVYNAPWPLDNRDAVIHSRIEIEDNKVAHIVSIFPDYMPEQKKLVRMPLLKSTLSFTLTEDNKIEVLYEGHANPGGKVPAWAANAVVEDTPFHTLLNLQKMSLN